MRKKTLIASALLGATAFSLAVALPANADSIESVGTVEVASGVLSTTATPTFALTDAAPGELATGTSAVSVSDLRAGILGWTTSVASTDFTSALLVAAGANGTIPASAVTFTTGVATASTGTPTLTNTDAPAGGGVVVTATDVSGNNVSTWDETINLTIPETALSSDDYVGTITYSTL
ncbi:hypothetical protein BH09ACT1_BH09ACT1_06120 [soil metagenome]